ncbi:membrane-associated phospholipid phosphatase [Bradyrhizobium sp. AZCC 1578]|uniref:phosphatase PAP2 family protein n=1 Tax=Bradyrhizobium sp. AZCC 1578 TaxID=3117027 RepID=UPI002FF1AE02
MDSDSWRIVVRCKLCCEGGLVSSPQKKTSRPKTAVLALLVTIVTTFLFTTGKRHAGLFVLTTVLSGAFLNTLLKLAFARVRPDLVAPLTPVSTLSFLSGHAAISAVCYLTLGLMLTQTQASRSVRIHLIMTAAILALLVGVSRIYLGVHFPSDVLAGWCFGTSWALICQMLMSYFQRTERIEQPSN